MLNWLDKQWMLLNLYASLFVCNLIGDVTEQIRLERKIAAVKKYL